MQTLNKKQQSGRSMIEMVGVLAVMGLITAGAFILISSANSSQRRNRVIDDVMNIATGVRSLYAEHDTLPTITSATVLSALSINSTSPYNTTYKVEKVTGTTFSVTVPGANENDCSALEIKNWKDAVGKSCNTTSHDFTVTFNK